MDGPNYEKLDVWRDSIELVKLVYRITSLFPKDELFSLTNQIRRAVVSVPANIAEGHGRGSKKEFKQYLLISRGSLQELNTLIEVARSMNYLTESEYQEVRKRILSLIRRISSLIKSLTQS